MHDPTTHMPGDDAGTPAPRSASDALRHPPRDPAAERRASADSIRRTFRAMNEYDLLHPVWLSPKETLEFMEEAYSLFRESNPPRMVTDEDAAGIRRMNRILGALDHDRSG